MAKLDVTVFSLDDEFLDIKRKKPTKTDKERAKRIKKSNKIREDKIKELSLLVEKDKAERKRLKSSYNYYRKQLSKTDNIERASLIDNKLEQLNSQLIQNENDIKLNKSKIKGSQVLIEDAEDDIKQLLNKDFKYIIRDNFNQPYEIEKPKGTSDEQTSINILKKYIRGMKRALKKDFYKSGKPVKKSTKDKIQFLIDNAEYNLDYLENGYSEDEFETDQNYYPLKVHFVGREIEINF